MFSSRAARDCDDVLTHPATGWRRRVLFTSALALVAALAVGTAAPPFADAGVLKRGSRGDRVKVVQRALHLADDGIYGAATKRAVRRFQRRHGLDADGLVGPATWSAILRARGAHRSSGGGGGASGGVRLLQRELGIGADGVFGPQTRQAVKRFQRGRGLTADGVVGPATWNALGHPGIRTVLKPRRGGRGSGIPIRVRRVIAAASRIAHTPYRYGGGHGSFSDSGYDCSGSVSYALHGGGLLGSPLDSSALMSWGSPGRGRWITVYAHGGHSFMVVHGRRFDTTGRGATGSRWQRSMRSTAGYVARHPAGL